MRRTHQFVFRALAVAVAASLVAIGVPSIAIAAVTDAPAPSATSAVADAQTAATETDARAIAEKFDHSVVVDSSTTETTQVTALADGQMQAVSSTLPVRVKSGGVWVPIDLTLTKTADGFVSPKATSVPVGFAAGGANVLSRVQAGTSINWVTETWPYGALPAPILAGATATYTDVLPGVDLRLTALVTGMSEVFVVKNAIAAADPRLQTLTLELAGATTSLKDGVTTATAADGSLLTSSAPTWWDSSDKGSDVSGPAPGTWDHALDRSVAGSNLVLNALSAIKAGTKYPLFIDPDWTGGVINRWFVDRGYPNTAYPNPSTRLKVGYASASVSTDNVNHLAHAFYQIDTSVVAGKQISNAVFNTTLNYSSSCTPTTVEVWQAANIAANGTWNTTAASAFQVGQSSQTVSYGHSGCANTSPHALGFTVTAATQNSASAGSSYMTLGMKASDETDSRAYKEFSPAASVTMTYNSKPNVPASPQMTSPPRGCSSTPVFINSTSGLTLQVNSTDPDAGQNVATNFYVTRIGVGLGLYASPLGAQGNQSVNVPASDLPEGAYSWNAEVSDYLVVSDRSPSCYFTVRNTAAPSPTISVAPASGSTVVGQPFSTRFHSAVTDGTAEFIYWWALGSATTPAPSVPATAPGPNGVLPACGSTSGIATFVCADANGDSPLLSVAPIDNNSTLWVATYDQAGNVSAAVPLNVNAADDTSNVSFVSGHGWRFSTSPSPYSTSIADQNTSTGTAISNGSALGIPSTVVRTTKATINGTPNEPILPLSGYMTLARAYNSATGDHLGYTDGGLNTGWVLQAVQGRLASPTLTKPSGTNSLYSCQITATDEMSSADATCEGSGATGVRLGYIWSAASPQPAGFIPLYRCHYQGDHYDTLDSACEGHGASDGLLGYLAPLDQVQTSRQVIDTTQSFSASAWVKPAMGTTSARSRAIFSEQDANGQGFYLIELPNGHLVFGLNGQAGTSVYGPALSDGAWSYVLVVWDKTNQQLRLSVGSTVSSFAVSPHASSSADVSATGPFILGGMLGDGMPEGQWSGQLSDPTVFQGVVSSTQLFNLYNQIPPQ